MAADLASPNLPPTDAWLKAAVSTPGAPTMWIIVALPDAGDDGTIASRLLAAGLTPHSQEPRVFVRKTLESARPLAHMIEALVAGRARNAPRMAVLAGEEEPSLREVRAKLEDFGRASARLRGQWLMPLLISRRVYAALMPIFDERGEVFAEDALGRAELSLDETVSGAQLFEAARDLNLVSDLDRLLRTEGFAAFSRAYPFEKPALFVRTAIEALLEPNDLQAGVAELSKAHAIPLTTVVSEISEPSIGDRSRVAAAVERLRSSGVRLSLSGLTPGPHAERVLRDLRPSFAKLDGPCIRAASRAPSSRERERAREELSALAAAASDVGATVVATGIESPEDLQLGQTIGASLYCGFLLCRPRRL